MEYAELSALFRTLVLPPAGPLIVGVLGCLLASTRRFRRTGLLLCAIAVGSLWLLSTPIIANRLTRSVSTFPPLDLAQPVSADAVVILAGGVRRFAPEYNEDAPNEITLQRIVYGARVARVTRLPVLVSGGRGEARTMATFLERDFATTPQWIESESRNTHENALFSAPILKQAGISRIVLVTSATHMPRAAAEFVAQGMQVIAAPVSLYSPRQGVLARWIPGIAGMRDSYNALYELTGDAARRLAAAWAGRSPGPPSPPSP
jgi:uncharacterized SAM-binding protein YcdF (DUF218 family)